jgi:hypothetical protein
VVTCDRCGRETRANIMSIFNLDVICMACKDRERLHPEYEAALAAEVAQVRRGNYNFEGVGLPPDLR